MTQTSTRKGVFSWMLFDWANQPFYTLIISFIFAPYFADAVVGDPVKGQQIWGNVIAVCGFCIAILAPVLGAIADQAGPRKPWIAGFSVLFLIGCCGLWLAEPGLQSVTLLLVLFALAYIGSEFMMIFYNAMLPDLGPRSELGATSGSGWAMGYAGGVAVLILVLLLISPTPGSDTTLIGIAPIFGLDPAAGEPARAAGPLTAIWFLVFAWPLFLYTKDAPLRTGIGEAMSVGMVNLGQTLRNLPSSGPLLKYLVASMIYRDALAGIFIFGAIFADGILGWGAFQLGVFGIVAALTGAFGAVLGGQADKAFGPKIVVSVSILVLIVVATVTLGTSRQAVLGIPLAEGSFLPDIIFYVCGGLLGAASGSLQAASRTLLVVVAEDRVPMTEAFGLYALSGKATAFIAPLMIGITTQITGSQAWGVSPVIFLLVLGLALLYLVKTDEAER